MSTQTLPATASSCLSAISKLVVDEAPIEEVLDYIFDSCMECIPYVRIGWAEISEDQDIVRARWARGKLPALLRRGFTAKLSGSSLYFVMQQRKPRVMDDLAKYLESRPHSRSTKLMLREGIRSSLTCPLFVGRKSLGFLFFSSHEPDVYSGDDCRFAMDVSRLLALRIAAAADETCTLREIAPLQSRAKYLPIDKLVPGMVLGEPLRTNCRSLLLASGHTLSAHSIERLKQMAIAGEIGFSVVKIDGCA